MGDWKTTEIGLSFAFPENLKKKLGNQWDVVKKLSTCRMISFLTVTNIAEEFQGIGMTAVACAEAVPSLGIAGLIWRKHLGDKVTVTVNVADEDAKSALAENAKSNELKDDELSVVCEDTNVLLHADKKYNFVYLECYGTAVRYLEAACHAVCHRGIICIVSTDLSTLYNKSPDRVRRMYGGLTMKHEYTKELAVRLIIASAIRSASRWDRGIEVLLSHVDECSITVIVRVLKGATHADKCLEKVQKVAHCRVCNYRCFIPEKLYHVPQPEITDCLCEQNNTLDANAPIVLLGPAYSGPIFSTAFIISMIKTLVNIEPKSKFVETLKTIAAESICFTSGDEETEFLKTLTGKTSTGKLNGVPGSEEPPNKKSKKTDRLEQFCQKHPQPALFYVGQTHTKKGFNPPKLLSIIQKLRSKGFQASRTMFDPRGVRTSASTKDLNLVVDEISQQTA